MKKIILLLILLPLLTFAQNGDFECGFVSDAGMFNLNNYTGTVKSDFSVDEPVIFNVFHHIISPVDDSDPFIPIITEEHVLASIAQLNIHFNRYNIFYKYRGFQEVRDIITYENAAGQQVTGPIYDAPVSVIKNYLNLSTDYNNMVNVLVLKETASGAPAEANRPAQIVQYIRAIFPDIAATKGVIMTHEFGHLVGLHHTFQGTYPGNNTIVNTICPPIPLVTEAPETLITPENYTNLAEHVTRVEFLPDGSVNPKFNAKNKGDMVVDTPAQFRWATYNYCKDLSTGIANYISHPNIVDNSGTGVDDPSVPYIDVDLGNFMSYDRRIKDHFTNGQAVRMRETIFGSDYITVYQPRLALLADGTADLSVLYMPYAGDYFYAGPSNPSFRPLFQPGFDYKFVYCGGQTASGYEYYNVPTIYDNISFYYKPSNILNQVDKFSMDINNMNHPNYSAIVIEQLENQPHKCYHNINRSASNGTVIKFLDGVPNTNVDIQSKNQTQINDTNLIQNLENGLYTIQKNFDDGTQEQQTILKNDN